jgi:hypothetical protein
MPNITNFFIGKHSISFVIDWIVRDWLSLHFSITHYFIFFKKSYQTHYDNYVALTSILYMERDLDFLERDLDFLERDLDFLERDLDFLERDLDLRQWPFTFSTFPEAE